MKRLVDVRPAMGVGTLATILLAPLGVPAMADAQTTTIVACRNDTNGNLRYVSGPGQCRQHETPVSWTSGGSSGVDGSGTPGTIPVWTGSGTTLTDSSMQEAPDGAISIDPGQTSSPVLDVRGEHAGPAVQGTNTAVDGRAAGVQGTCTADDVFCAGVQGIATGAASTGVRGLATAATGGTNTGVGGFTWSSSDGTNGVFGMAYSPTGITFGVQGMSNSINGVGVQGSAMNNAVVGINQTCGASGCTPTTGNAGAFATAAGGNILVGHVAGASGWSTQFRVDSTGRGFFNGGTQVGGADFAESVAVVADPARYEPGDLLVVDPTLDRHLALSSRPYATAVAGIYSTRPGILAMPHAAIDGPGASEVPVAIVGIVPCKVSAENGPIRRGDLLVSSSTPGHAMRGSDRDRMLGAVVGKALGELREGTGVIEVLVTLQ